METGRLLPPGAPVGRRVDGNRLGDAIVEEEQPVARGSVCRSDREAQCELGSNIGEFGGGCLFVVKHGVSALQPADLRGVKVLSLP